MEERILHLLDLYTRNQADRPQTEELFRLLDNPGYHRYFEEYLLARSERESYGLQTGPVPAGPDWDLVWQRISAKQRVVKIGWKQWAVAASVVILLGLASFLYLRKNNLARDKIVAYADVSAPATQRPELVLDNGATIPLDSIAANNTPGVQRGENGRLFVLPPSVDQPIVQRTVRNPRGSRIVDLTLPDSSRIWLNAGSSISFPSAFGNAARGVVLSGEAFFEVSRDPHKPFIVRHGVSQTEVLGTGFNISAYPGNATSEVTLVHGSVRVGASDMEQMLVPGQQAGLLNGRIVLNKHPDIEKVLAWKNEEFIFENDEIGTILYQLEQWYDVDFSAVPDPGLKYTGRLNRSVPLSSVLHLFERLGHIQFAIHGKKVEVSTPLK